MVDGDVPAICVIANVVQAQNETIVDIAHADAGLIKFSGIDVVTCGSQKHPICIELDLSCSQDPLTAIEEPEFRLRRVITVQQASGPAVKRRTRF